MNTSIKTQYQAAKTLKKAGSMKKKVSDAVSQKSSRSGSEVTEEAKPKVKKAKMPPPETVVEKTEEVKPIKNLKQIVYIFIARDSDMFVYESHLEAQVTLAKFQSEIFEMLGYYMSIHSAEERPQTQCKDLLFDNL